MARAAASGSSSFRRNIQSQESIALSGVRLARLAEERVLDRDRGHLRELDEEILVLLGEAAGAVGEDLDQAQVPPVAPGERRRQDVVGLQRAVPVPIRGETRAVRVDEPGGAPGP